ncbi:sensor histidine kinase [Arthrobacter sp. 3Tela_A]|uniref:sensor histidine kinase n=1 Tax=Arthrobacter sp. 3Tela_A TaxID=3093743 RepID=UPI003BB5EC0A
MSSFKGRALSLLGIHKDFHELSLRVRVALSQLPLFTAVAVLMPLVLIIKPSAFTDPALLTGLALIGILSALSVGVAWEKYFQPAYWIIPILDFVAIGFLYNAVRPEVTGTVLLSVFPVFWLAWSGHAPKTAALLTVTGSLLIVWSPPLLAGSTRPEDYLSVLMMAVVNLLVHKAASVMTLSADGQQLALEQKDRALKTSLQDSRRRAQLLDAVLEAIDVGVIVLAKDGHVMLMNSRQLATHALALPADDKSAEADLLLFEQDGHTPVPPEDRPLARAMRREAFSDCLISIGRGPGQRAMAVSARPLLDEHGEFNGSVMAFSDVTDMLRALRAKDDFVASVSHELRTPLTSIIGYLDLALDADEDQLHPQLRSSLEVTLRNAERLLVIVSDLLTTASGSVHLERTELCLGELATCVAGSAQPRAQAAGVELRLDIPEPVRGSFDQVRLQQVLDNLLSNAIKYSPDGGTVTVRVRREGELAVLEVQDQGIGMTEAEQAEVFTRFFRSAAVKKAAIPGVGLGLGITRDIVEAHGGRVTVSSRPGAGSVFRVELPRESCARQVGAAG